MRTPVLGVLMLLVLSAGCAGESDEEEVITFTRGEEIEVRSLALFRIELGGSPDEGDDWRLVSTPAPSIAQWQSGSGYDPPEAYMDEGGRPGRWQFVFKAIADGTTEFELLNCYRCGWSSKPLSQYESRSERLTVPIVVVD